MTNAIPSTTLDTILAGYLKKKSPRGPHFLSLWQKRYFELYCDVLIYRKKEAQKAIGAIPLSQVFSAQTRQDKGGQRFELVLAGETRTFALMAASKKEALQWVSQINKLIALIQRELSPDKKIKTWSTASESQKHSKYWKMPTDVLETLRAPQTKFSEELAPNRLVKEASKAKPSDSTSSERQPVEPGKFDSQRRSGSTRLSKDPGLFGRAFDISSLDIPSVTATASRRSVTMDSPTLDVKTKSHVTLDDVSKSSLAPATSSSSARCGKDRLSLVSRPDSVITEATLPVGLNPLTAFRSSVTYKDFKVLESNGEGAFGLIFLVQNIHSGKLYLMQVVGPEIENFQLGLESIIHLSRLSHNYLIQQLHSGYEEKSRLHWAVISYAPGGPLYNYLRLLKRFDEPTAAIIAAQVILVTHYLHTENLIFRNLDPENLWVDEKGHVIVTDLGVTIYSLDQALEERLGSTILEYSTPEFLEGNPESFLSDWYRFGILLYELVVGIPPFRSPDPAELRKKILKGVVKFPPFVSLTFKDLIMKLLKKDPSRRLGSIKGSKDIKNHFFFKNIDWIAVKSKSHGMPSSFLAIVSDHIKQSDLQRKCVMESSKVDKKQLSSFARKKHLSIYIDSLRDIAKLPDSATCFCFCVLSYRDTKLKSNCSELSKKSIKEGSCKIEQSFDFDYAAPLITGDDVLEDSKSIISEAGGESIVIQVFVSAKPDPESFGALVGKVEIPITKVRVGSKGMIPLDWWPIQNRRADISGSLRLSAKIAVALSSPLEEPSEDETSVASVSDEELKDEFDATRNPGTVSEMHVEAYSQLTFQFKKFIERVLDRIGVVPGSEVIFLTHRLMLMPNHSPKEVCGFLDTYFDKERQHCFVISNEADTRQVHEFCDQIHSNKSLVLVGHDSYPRLSILFRFCKEMSHFTDSTDLSHEDDVIDIIAAIVPFSEVSKQAMTLLVSSYLIYTNLFSRPDFAVRYATETLSLQGKPSYVNHINYFKDLIYNYVRVGRPFPWNSVMLVSPISSCTDSLVVIGQIEHLR